MRVQRNDGRWLKADTLGPEFVEVVRIADVKHQLVGEDRRYCLYFQDHDKALPLNAGNLDALIGLFGEESERWIGQRIELFTAETSFQGKRMLGIRVRPASVTASTRTLPPAEAAAPPPSRPHRVERTPGEDDEPLSHRAIRW